MTWLLDTNVVSELRKPARLADAGMQRWAAAQPVPTLHISAITILELELGIRRRERRDPEQGRALRAWLENRVLPGFEHRILPVDTDIALRAASLHVPDPRPERDALIAATASVHGFTVVTRNGRDFSPLGAPVLNPWDGKPA